jgi:hypothetical protein
MESLSLIAQLLHFKPKAVHFFVQIPLAVLDSGAVGIR